MITGSLVDPYSVDLTIISFGFHLQKKYFNWYWFYEENIIEDTFRVVKIRI